MVDTAEKPEIFGTGAVDSAGVVEMDETTSDSPKSGCCASVGEVEMEETSVVLRDGA